MRSKDEEILQTACVTWFDYQYPQFRQLLFAVPNGGSRHKLEAINLKKQGVRAGISDIILLVPNIANNLSFLCIEFKTKKGVQQSEQINFETAINKYSKGAYILIRSFEEFKENIEYYLS